MPKGQAIDVGKVHNDLWEKSDRLGRLKIIQKDLAVEIGVTHFAITRLFSRMEKEGRIKRLTSHKLNIWTYIIRDPQNFV